MTCIAVDQVRLSVVVSGNEVEGLIHVHLSSNNAFAADRYAVTFAMGPPPLRGIAFWSALVSAYVEISASSDSTPAETTLVTGMADSLAINPLAGTVSIEGRDLSAALVDTYRQKDFVNQTASEIVSAIAANHGLAGAVTPTTGSVGRFYADNHTRLSVGQFSRLRSDWDLIAQLARENGFDAYVQGTTLYFQPATIGSGSTRLLGPRDVTAVRWERTLALADSPSVRVQSWNSQNMASYFVGPAPSLPVGGITDGYSPSYLFSGSNLTSQQASESAQMYMTEISRLGTALHIEMPWDLTVSPRTVFLMRNVASAIDGTYRVESLDRTYNASTGSVQQMRASLVNPVSNSP
jgi:hypothetical protein